MKARFRLPTGVRGQATVAAAAVVAVALLLGSVVLVLVLQGALAQALQESVTAVVDEDASVLAVDGTTGLERSERDEGPDNVLVQVISQDGGLGRVVYTSKASRTAPITDARPTVGQTVITGRSSLPLPGDLQDPLVVARGVDIDGRPYVLAAQASQEARGQAVRTTALLLAVAVPFLVALTAMVTWWRVGRALRSVEAIRAHVERTSAARLRDRVPVPQSRDEIADLALTMNSMLARLEASQSAQRRFVADASHELRSPLATIRASLDVVSPDDPDTSWEQLDPILRGETERMSRLVDHLLLLSQADDDALTVSWRDVDLDDLVDEEARRLRQVSRLTVQVASAAVRVRGDVHQLQQVLRNLLDNAARHAVASVRVTVQQDAQYALVRVEDDGPGIRESDRERVFERFFRLDESRSRHSGGSGLGLAIARELAAAHHGALSVRDSPLGGASFELTLPLPATPWDPQLGDQMVEDQAGSASTSR
ncbi:HAMP domain-containing sensor histidine kinase [Terrabacter sp. NPDC000476]|uniref:sensor histidine kinase n=1 Tax=Terrabacter sp. NPDC000476 TaxID=3154258 RepID=UPI00332458A8